MSRWWPTPRLQASHYPDGRSSRWASIKIEDLRDASITSTNLVGPKTLKGTIKRADAEKIHRHR